MVKDGFQLLDLDYSIQDVNTRNYIKQSTSILTAPKRRKAVEADIPVVEAEKKRAKLEGERDAAFTKELGKMQTEVYRPLSNLGQFAVLGGLGINREMSPQKDEKKEEKE